MESTLTIRRVSLDSLELDPGNARTHGDENLAAISESLKRFGQAEPLVVQARTKRVVGGNGRLVAMRTLGWTECDVVELDLSDQEARALGLALNRTGELAGWDESRLAEILQSLRVDDALEGVGFSDEEIDALVASLEAGALEVTEDEVPEPPEAAVTRPGDLWSLGSHRLLCGNSASWEDVERLLAGAPVHLLNTDPPYNVKVEPRSNNAIAAGLSSFGTMHHQALDLARHPTKAMPTTERLRPKDRPLTNDYLPDEEFAQLLRQWFGNASRAMLPGSSFYVWGGYANVANYPPALAESGLYFSQAIIWNKLHPVLTRKDYMGAHEWCFHGWKEGAGHSFYGPANATDLWEIKKVNPQSMVHLTEKPVELAARAIAYSSKPGENVLDLFGGSGSTLVACEQLGRKAFLMEIDAPYCDVILERYQKLSGKEPTLDGVPFTAVAQERRA